MCSSLRSALTEAQALSDRRRRCAFGNKRARDRWGKATVVRADEMSSSSACKYQEDEMEDEERKRSGEVMKREPGIVGV